MILKKIVSFGAKNLSGLQNPTGLTNEQNDG
jgi:hypothetical protein